MSAPADNAVTLVVMQVLSGKELYRGPVPAVPREGDLLEIKGASFTAGRVVWALPKRGEKLTVMVYAS